MFFGLFWVIMLIILNICSELISMVIDKKNVVGCSCGNSI